MEIDLRVTLEAFDGKHTESLEKIADSLPPEPHILQGLVELALNDERKLQSAGTWLLKRFLEEGVKLDRAQTEALLQALTRDSHWEAKLHVLQMLDKLTIQELEISALWDTLIEETGHQNKLLRTWSYHGIAVIADQHRDYRDKAASHLALGETDEAASVRARIRRLRKSLAWLRS